MQRHRSTHCQALAGAAAIASGCALAVLLLAHRRLGQLAAVKVASVTTARCAQALLRPWKVVRLALPLGHPLAVPSGWHCCHHRRWSGWRPTHYTFCIASCHSSCFSRLHRLSCCTSTAYLLSASAGLCAQRSVAACSACSTCRRAAATAALFMSHLPAIPPRFKRTS